MDVDVGCDGIIEQTTGPLEPCPKRLAFEAKSASKPSEAASTEDDILDIHNDGQYIYQIERVHKRSSFLCNKCQEEKASRQRSNSEQGKAEAGDGVSGGKEKEDDISPSAAKKPA